MNHHDVLNTIVHVHDDGYTVDGVYVDDEMYEMLRDNFDLGDDPSGEKVGTVTGYDVYVDNDNPRIEASGGNETRTYPID